MEKILKNRTEVRVRYAETDKMGVVNNGTYLTYFEVGRAELMRKYELPYSKCEAEGYLLPVIEAHLNFFAPAFYDDLLIIEASMKLERKATIKFDYNILRNNTTIVSGYTIHSFIKEKSFKAVKPPEAFWEHLNKFFE